MMKVADYIEDRPVQNEVARPDRPVAEHLHQTTLASARRGQQQNVSGLTDESAGGQVVYLLFLDRGVELPVEVFQRLEVADPARFVGLTNSARWPR